MRQDVLDFRILGPLEVSEGARLVSLGGPRQQALLACLLLRAGEPVAADWLIEQLWADESGDRAGALQVAVSRLRKALGDPTLIRTQAPGYALEIEPEQLDATRFALAHAEGTRQLAVGETSAAARLLREALAIWRGPPLADFRYEPFAQAEIARLEEARLDCLAERIEADLALGQHAKLIGELESLTAEHPLQERLRGQLMLALYRSGRQADALEVYQATRLRLVEELGIEPSGELRDLHQAILRQDAELDLHASAQPAPDAPAEMPEGPLVPGGVRKTVTVLVRGPAESLHHRRVDPELRGQLGQRAFETIAPVLERHGAALERLLDDRVAGIFGVPAAHEDDGLRAIRAAVELREALTPNGDELRIGIDTGEVLTGNPAAGERLVTGDTLDGAAFLQQSSRAGGIVIGDATRSLVGDAVKVEPLELDTTSATGPPVWQLLELVPGAPALHRSFDAPFVGRDRELSQLRQAFERATRERRPELVTVFGEAGIGKTRLGVEFARSLAQEAVALTGRCLSYGEGITYWPLREIVQEAAGERPIADLVAEAAAGPRIAECVSSALGQTAGAVAVEESFWGFRKLFECLSRRQPLVLVIEDLHWAEPTLLDLVEHVVMRSADSPMLILCLTRPELLEDRPAWAAGLPNASSVQLERLSTEDATQLLASLGRHDRTQRISILETAQGNPLFLEQVAALLAERRDPTGDVPLPTTVEAVLAARLDRLDATERMIVDRAAVIGKEFWQGAVEALLPDAHPTAAPHLEALIHRQLLQAAPPSQAGEDSFRFRHVLIQQAAYRSIPKAVRAALHERFAQWLEDQPAEQATELDELVGFHLEQAYRFRHAVSQLDERQLVLGARASSRLTSAGRRASERGDAHAAANLLRRAAALLPDANTARGDVLLELAEALIESGELAEADTLLERVAQEARDRGERGHEAHARILGLQLQVIRHSAGRTAEARQEAESAISVFEDLGADRALARAWLLMSTVHLWACHGQEMEAALRQALAAAERARDRRQRAEILSWLVLAVAIGPTPVTDGTQQLEAIAAAATGEPTVEAPALEILGYLYGRQFRFSEARALFARARMIYDDLGMPLTAARQSIMRAWTHLIMDDPATAETDLRTASEELETMGERGYLSTVSGLLARALYAQERYEEADQSAAECRRLGASDDILDQIMWRGVRGKVLARRRHFEEAEALAREGVDLSATIDFLEEQGNALSDLAEVLRLAGRRDEAATPFTQAAAIYERKGNVVSAAKARALFEEVN